MAVVNRRRQLDHNQHEYLAPSPDRVVDQKILSLVAMHVTGKVSGPRVLELGVGDQVWTPLLLDRFSDVTTVDGSADLLDAMALNVPQSWQPVHSLFEDYWPENQFDSVVASYVLEHVDDPLEVLTLMRERWMKPGGEALIVVPHALSLHRRLAVKMGLMAYPAELGPTDRRMEHLRCLTYYEMERLIIEAGLEIEEREGLVTKVLPNSLLAGCSDDQLKGLFDLGRELPIDYAGAIYYKARSKR